MEITVKMTPEEYDLFRKYQNKKDFFEKCLKKKEEDFIKKYEELAAAVVSALTVESSDLYSGDKVVETATAAIIKDNDAAVKAHATAWEWYA